MDFQHKASVYSEVLRAEKKEECPLLALLLLSPAARNPHEAMQVHIFLTYVHEHCQLLR